MAFSVQHIITEMQRQGIVPLFTHDDPEDTLAVVTIAYECGLRAFEFTNRRSRSFEVFQHLIRHRRNFPEMSLGIGTIMDPLTTRKYIDAGADFIISPILNLDMGIVCNQHSILWIAGCATPTEIITAKDHGSELIKVFPGSTLGPAFVKAMLQVAPDLKLMVTGGVEATKQNLSSWFEAGAVCVGMGSQLVSGEILKTKNWVLLKERFAHMVELAQEIRIT